MTQTRDPEARTIVRELARSAPPAPALPDLTFAEVPRRGPSPRVRVAVAVLAAVVAVGVVAAIGFAGRDSSSPRVTVATAPKQFAATAPAQGIALLTNGTSTQNSSSFAMTLLDETGAPIAHVPSQVIPNDATNSPWRTTLVRSATSARLEAQPFPASATTANGCTQTSAAASVKVAVCGTPRLGEQLLGDRLSVNIGRGWEDLAMPVAGGGHWEGAVVSPDGRWVLAQWSGECEIPTAFLIRVVDRTRWDIAKADSIMLGWTKNNQALVSLQESGCGTSAPVPGVYRVTPGSRAAPVLVAKLPANSLVVRWTKFRDAS